MRDDREAILRRLCSGEQEAPAAAAVATTVQATYAALPPPPPLPAAPATDSTGLIAAFTAATQANQSAVECITALNDLPAVVAAFLRHQQAPPRVVCEASFAALPWQSAGLTATARAPNQDDTCGITGVHAAAASNGALLLMDDIAHRLTLSLILPYHVAVVPAAKIHADLPGLWRQLPQPLPRGCVLAAGPSRTADIEQTLTIGAHGPIAVLVVIVDANAAGQPLSGG